ncbi:hypothetical protein [Bacteroides ovatus]|uniref:hypothetical protein n=1 Tax=Bacteroides ovatus TaxID=28116 RepID=UPI0018986D1A|nr:hypothetical protein [Bacteroides ovatus]
MKTKCRLQKACAVQTCLQQQRLRATASAARHGYLSKQGIEIKQIDFPPQPRRSVIVNEV